MMAELETVVVDAVIYVDHAGQICSVEQSGRRYDIVDPLNVGNARFGKVVIQQPVTGNKFLGVPDAG